MTWEELFLALQQVYQTDKELMKQKITCVTGIDGSIFIDLFINTQGTRMCFCPDVSDDSEE